MKLNTIIKNWFLSAKQPISLDSSDYAKLEDRIVYSAAPLGEVVDIDDPEFADAHDDDVAMGFSGFDTAAEEIHDFDMDSLDADELATLEDVAAINDFSNDFSQELITELVFVDVQTENYEQLVNDLLGTRNDGSLEVVLIDADADGVAVITKTLSRHSGLDAIHIVSHGTDGQVQLGNTWLDQSSLLAYSGDVAGWGDALNSDGDMLIYGCDLAGDDAGLELLDSLNELTQADIAASDDLTGHADLGGDWEFEFTIGAIDTNIAFSQDVIANWYGTLGTVTVTTTQDIVSADADLSSIAALNANAGSDGFISLREAVIAANANSDADVINLQAGTYALVDTTPDSSGPDASTGDLDIVSELSIEGVDATSTIITGAGGKRIFSVFSSDVVTIEDISLVNGAGKGGAIRVQSNATLELHNSILSGNNLSTANNIEGGALSVTGTANITNTSFLGNGSFLTTTTGGAIHVESAGVVTLDQVEISGSKAVDGGGIYNEGQLTIIDSFIQANEAVGKGGGIWHDAPGGSLVIESSTLAFNNAADGGGLLASSGGVDVTNSTFSANGATNQGGAIYMEGDVSLTHVTLAYNSAGGGARGIFEDGGTLTLDHTLLHNGNTDTDDNADSVGTNAVNSLGLNLATGFVNGFASMDFENHNIADIGLSPSLIDNGGPVWTHAVQVGSDAHDAGPATITIDQRGFLRDSLADIGAFEVLGSAPPTLTAVNDTSFIVAEDQAITPSTVPADIGLLANDVLTNPEIVQSAIRFEYDASKSGTNSVWNDETGVPGFDFTASNGSLSKSASVNTIAAITDSYFFDGTNNATTNPLQGIPGDPTDNNSTFEFWIRPTDANVGREVIFETGSQPNGTSLVLNGLDYGPGVVAIELAISESNALGTRTTTIELDVTQEVTNGEFIHVVIALDTDNADEITIYATGEDGFTDDKSANPLFGFTDWSAGQKVSLGGPDASVAGGDTGFFEGEISVVRFYDGLPSFTDVQQSYEAMHLEAVAGTVVSSNNVLVTVNADGTFTYDPGTTFDYLADGETAVDTFTYTVVTSAGIADTATATIAILGVNDDPILQANMGATIAVADTLTIPTGSLVATDIDHAPVDFGYTLSEVPTAGSLFLNTTLLTLGNFVSQADIDAGLLTYQHDGTPTTTNDSFEFTVSDVDGGSSAAGSIFNITVTNAAPIVNDESIDVLEGIGGIYDVIGNDIDPEGQPISIVSIDTATTEGTASLSGNMISYSPDTSFFDYLLPGQTASDTVLYTISDGASFPIGEVTFIVYGVNDGPSLDTIMGADLNANEAIEIDASMLSASDADHSAGELTYTLATIPSAANGILYLDGVALGVGSTFTQEDIDNGMLRFEATSVFSGDSFKFNVSDPLLATTATGTFNLAATRTISGTIFEDVNGDSDLLDGVAVTGSKVDVHLYEDVDGDGLIEASDTYVTSTQTDLNSGQYVFTGLELGDYYVVVDSTDIAPNAGTSDATRIWAEQTYGTEGSYIADGSGGTTVRTDAGAAFGGRLAGVSDNASDLLTAEHVTRVSLAGGDAASVDFGFSFNAVTNHLGGDLTVDDTSRNTWVQGSLRQFIENANHIFGSNEMRFTPTTQATDTDTDGTNAWWTIDISDLLPRLSDSSGATIIDGTAYNFTDGVSLRNSNTATVGGDAGYALPGADGILGTADDTFTVTGTVGTGADGVRGTGDETPFTGVEGTELSIVSSVADLDYGIKATGDGTTIRGVTVRGFGDSVTNAGANIWIDQADNVLIENVVIGAGETMTPAQLDTNIDGGGHHGIYIQESDDGSVLNVVAAGHDYAGIRLAGTDNWTLAGNEIRANSQRNSAQDGIDIAGSLNGTLTGNLVANNLGGGIDTFRSDGQLLIAENTVSGNGSVGGEGAGIRLFGDNSVVTHNIIDSNVLDGVLVTGRNTNTGDTAAVNNEISQNSFANNGQLAIDLSRDHSDTGNGFDAIDNSYDTNYGNQGIDRPTAFSAIAWDNNTNLAVTIGGTFNQPDFEVYLADASGEGATYLFTSAYNDTLAAYQSTAPSGISAGVGDEITFLAIDENGNTSEFSNTATIVEATADDAYTILEGATVTGDVSTNDAVDSLSGIVYAATSSTPGLALATDGTFSYAHPDPDFFGSVTFDYTVTDAFGRFSTATVTIDILPVNDQQVVVDSGPASVGEGLSTVIDQTLLFTDDVDNTAGQLVYNVTAETSFGQLELLSNPGAAVTSFTQQDIDNNQLIYVHDGSDTSSDAFEFTVDDGDGAISAGTFDIDIQNVEEDLVANETITLLEGTSTAITSADLLTTDSDDSPSELVYTTTSPSTNGQLELVTNPGVAITTFTQAELDAGLVVYVNNSTGPTSDSFDFTVDDNGQGTSTSATFNINLVHTKNAPAVVAEAGTFAISPGELCYTDSIHASSDFVYSVQTLPANGQLELASNPGTAITSFTQQDIDSGLLVYVHDSSDTVSDRFEFSVTNAAGESYVGDFVIQVVNAEETITTNAPLSVAEGGSQNISAADLSASDTDDAPTQLVYNVISGPASGTLELSTNSGTAVTTFTQADIDSGLLTYIHDGTDTAADSFDFTVDDGQGAIHGGTFSLNVVNAEEALVTNETLNVAEDGSGIIANALLNTTDVDDAPGQIEYVITSGTNHGQLTLLDNPGVVATTFTQADIDAGQLVYTQNGQDETSDSFSFTVDDGQGATSSGQFDITITNTEQVLNPPSPLFVGEGRTGAITNSLLLTTDVDDPSSQIIYIVTTAPENGQLELTTNPGVAVTTFTQKQINDGELVYNHDGSDTTSDFFDFTVDEEGGEGTVSSGKFKIAIGNADQVLNPPSPLFVGEGLTGTITNSLLLTTDVDDPSSQLIYNVTTAPENGQLELTTNPGVAVTTFTQKQINDGELVYAHDSSDTASDFFDFTVDEEGGEGIVSSGKFEIVIGNSEQILSVSNPLSVAEGATGTIANTLLSTIDSDDASSDLVYTITGAPTHGKLEFRTAPGTSISTFTQQDVDSGNLIYVHAGSDSTSDSFDFKVDDGQGSKTVSVFRINIGPTNDAPIIVAPGQQATPEGSTFEFSSADGNPIELADTDSGTSDVQLSIAVTNGTVSLPTTTGLTFLVGDGNDDNALRLLGTIDELNSALDGLEFNSASGFVGQGEIVLELNDLGNVGDPGPLLATATVPIDIYENIVAENDSFSVIANQELGAGSVIANDTLSNAAPPDLVSGPSNGTLIWNGDGSFVYTPDVEFVGTDSFEYSLGNGQIADTAVVVLSVLPVPPANSVEVVDVGLIARQPTVGVAGGDTSMDDGNGEPISDSGDLSTADTVMADESLSTLPPGTNSVSRPGSGGGSTSLTPPREGEAFEDAEQTTATEELSIFRVRDPTEDESRRSYYDAYESGGRLLQVAALGGEQFVTGAFSVGTELGRGTFFALGSELGGESGGLSAEFVSWQVPTGLVLTGGLSVGWVIWSLNSGYIIGSLLSSLSPWSLVDPLPVLEAVGPVQQGSATTVHDDDKLEEMID